MTDTKAARKALALARKFGDGYELHRKAMRKIGLPPLTQEQWQAQDDANEAVNAAALEHSETHDAAERQGRRHAHAARAPKPHGRGDAKKAHQPRATKWLRHRVARLKASGISDADIAKVTDLTVEAVAEYADESPRLDNGETRVPFDPQKDATAHEKRRRKLERAQELGRHAPPRSDVERHSPHHDAKRAERLARRLSGSGRR